MGSTATVRSGRGVKATNGSNGRNGRAKLDKRQSSDYLDPDQLLAVLEAVRKGDFSRRFKGTRGHAGQVYAALNDIIEKNERLTSELARISQVVGRDGQIEARAAVPN